MSDPKMKFKSRNANFKASNQIYIDMCFYKFILYYLRTCFWKSVNGHNYLCMLKLKQRYENLTAEI